MPTIDLDQVRHALGRAGDKPHVLVVDDEADVLEAVVETLEQLAVPVTGVEDIDQAQHHLASGRVNLVVLDLHLGASDGLALLLPLSRLRPKPGLILLSGLDSPILRNAEEAALGLGLCVLGVLEKPFSRHELFRLLLKRLEVLHARRDDASEAARVTEDEFSRALKSGNILPHLQPQYRLQDGSLLGFEALARWPDAATGNVIPAARFVHLLEKARFHLPVFRTMLTGTLAALHEHDGSAGHLSVSVNVPAALFGDEVLLEVLLQQCDRFGIAPARVVLELTESDYAPLDQQQRLGMTRLRVHGFGLSLDDFGVGTASLERLTQLPLTEVKLDAQFLARAADGESESLELVQMVSGLFASQGLLTVAEGVSDPATWQLACDMDFDIGQGYHLGTPMPPAEAFAVSKTLPFECSG